MSPARVIDTQRLSTVAHEYERDIFQFFHDLAAIPREQAEAHRVIDRSMREVVMEPFEQTRVDREGELLTRVGSGKRRILFDAGFGAAGIVSAVWAGRLIHELGMYDDFALWIWAHSPARNQVVHDLCPECVVVAEPTNLCIQMREAATEGYLSESHPLVQAAIATYETLYELPPIVSQPAAPLAPMGFPAIAFGAGDDGGIRHLLKAVQFYAAFPTTYVETVGRG